MLRVVRASVVPVPLMVPAIHAKIPLTVTVPVPPSVPPVSVKLTRFVVPLSVAVPPINWTTPAPVPVITVPSAEVVVPFANLRIVFAAVVSVEAVPMKVPPALSCRLPVTTLMVPLLLTGMLIFVPVTSPLAAIVPRLMNVPPSGVPPLSLIVALLWKVKVAPGLLVMVEPSPTQRP